jgi:hypothetical protein
MGKDYAYPCEMRHSGHFISHNLYYAISQCSCKMQMSVPRKLGVSVSPRSDLAWRSYATSMVFAPFKLIDQRVDQSPMICAKLQSLTPPPQ